MKYIEAVILTICMAIVWFPSLCIGGITMFVVEIVSFVMEQITDDSYAHGGVTDIFKWYVATIRKTYTQIINYDKQR